MKLRNFIYRQSPFQCTSCACVDSLLSKDYSADTYLHKAVIDKPRNDLVSEERKLPLLSWCLFFFFLGFCVNRTLRQLIVTIPTCVLDTSTLWSKGNASSARKGDYLNFNKINKTILGFVTRGFEISAVKYRGTEKERWWKYTFLRTKTKDMERNWGIGSF